MEVEDRHNLPLRVTLLSDEPDFYGLEPTYGMSVVPRIGEHIVFDAAGPETIDRHEVIDVAHHIDVYGHRIVVRLKKID